MPRRKKQLQYLNSINHEKITPAYTWLIENKLEKIYPDLVEDHNKTMQGLRLWWWTTFSGKNIIEELLNGQKFKGTNSTEWLTIKKSLIHMQQLGKVTKNMAEKIEKLKRYFHDSMIDEFKNRISEGDIP